MCPNPNKPISLKNRWIVPAVLTVARLMQIKVLLRKPKADRQLSLLLSRSRRAA